MAPTSGCDRDALQPVATGRQCGRCTPDLQCIHGANGAEARRGRPSSGWPFESGSKPNPDNDGAQYRPLVDITITLQEKAVDCINQGA